jgi:hypothetical protein
MQWRILLFLSFMTLISMAGCFNTDLVAPTDSNVRLIAEDVPVDFHKEYKNWYLLLGLLPIYTKQPAEIIEKEDLVEVRVQTEDTISDGVITILTAIVALGLYPQSGWASR